MVPVSSGVIYLRCTPTVLTLPVLTLPQWLIFIRAECFIGESLPRGFGAFLTEPWKSILFCIWANKKPRCDIKFKPFGANKISQDTFHRGRVKSLYPQHPTEKEKAGFLQPKGGVKTQSTIENKRLNKTHGDTHDTGIKFIFRRRR